MSTADTLAARYGVASPWRRRVLVAAVAVLALAAVGWLAWSVWSHSTPRVTSELEAYDVVDDYTVTATLVVELADDEVEATCTLQALAEDHTVVGELTFAPDPQLGQRQVQEIRTERRATAVTSLGCTAPGQNRPR